MHRHPFFFLCRRAPQPRRGVAISSGLAFSQLRRGMSKFTAMPIPAAPDTSDAARDSPPDTNEDGEELPPIAYCFDLRWAVSGNLIKTLKVRGDVDVEWFIKLLEEGYFALDGAPRAAVGESYHLFADDIELECGRYFSFYNIPRNATILVVRRSA